MNFVNDISDIVHHTVHSLQGQPNKNIGEAFLIVWKFPEQNYIQNFDENEENTFQLKKDKSTI